MNAKAVGLASGENSHQYLLLLFGINTEGILLSCRTVKIVDNKVFHLIWVLADNGTDFSQVQAFNGTVYNGTFQDHSQDTVKSGLCTVKVSGDQYDSKIADQKGASNLQTGIFMQDHGYNIGTTSGSAYVKYHVRSYCWQDNRKAQLQEYIMCQRETKRIDHFTGTYIKRQGKGGINSPAHRTDSQKEKSEYNQRCVDDPHECAYIPLRKQGRQDNGQTGCTAKCEVIWRFENGNSNCCKN